MKEPGFSVTGCSVGEVVPYQDSGGGAFVFCGKLRAVCH
jgi:hypothetical protein